LAIVLRVFTASDYLIGILAIVLLVFTGSDYIIGILAIVLLVFTASELHYWYLGRCLACLYGI
jgi:hypothetical protein